MKKTGHKSQESSFNGIMNFLISNEIIKNQKEVSKTSSLVIDIIHDFLKSENMDLIKKRDNISNQKNSILVQKNWQRFIFYIQKNTN